MDAWMGGQVGWGSDAGTDKHRVWRCRVSLEGVSGPLEGHSHLMSPPLLLMSSPLLLLPSPDANLGNARRSNRIRHRLSNKAKFLLLPASGHKGPSCLQNGQA